ncbi:SDR family NAD(P)-dependent oxidoreductase [Parvibaculaceae bacterium PLY_AMNH_Bact1]|nr:SDR family NAD(P)-dependent oxidoreductase [Parvibaculaceae bacterium PLY_AMNH_Bact1]
MARSTSLTSFPCGGVAIVVGASGGIGAALVHAVARSGRFSEVRELGRSTSPPLDLLAEESIAEAASSFVDAAAPPRLIIDATGLLHGGGLMPEKSLAQIDGAQLDQLFAVNAIGPALLMKHFLPLLPNDGKSVFATLSAKVGSIGDNQLGGWYGYRASKAALNQFVRTAAIEVKRRKPAAVCVALHPGTVATDLSAPFAKDGLAVQTPGAAAVSLLKTIEDLSVDQTGGFYSYEGEELPW